MPPLNTQPLHHSPATGEGGTGSSVDRKPVPPMVDDDGGDGWPFKHFDNPAKARVLIACEYSATVRDAFRARGFDAWSCDILPTEGDPRWHYQADVFSVLDDGWDLLIAHPPCTYLSRAGARWWKVPGRQELADKAADFVLRLWNAPVKHIAIENPIGQLNTRWRRPDQTIQPWEYGHPFSKATCLWLKRLPPLMPTDIYADYVPLIRSNVTATKRAGKVQRGKLSGGLESARTFAGIAAAMADQWGAHIAGTANLNRLTVLSEGGSSAVSEAGAASFHSPSIAQREG